MRRIRSWVGTGVKIEEQGEGDGSDIGKGRRKREK